MSPCKRIRTALAESGLILASAATTPAESGFDPVLRASTDPGHGG